MFLSSYIEISQSGKLKDLSTSYLCICPAIKLYIVLSVYLFIYLRVSAVEISQDERLQDLLASYASESDQSPGVYLGGASQSSLLQNLAEVRTDR